MTNTNERIDTTNTNCDGCGAITECAMLGPDGHYTLALCADCHKPLREQKEKDAMTELFGEVISSYSRAQALEDGILVDAGSMAQEAGFVFPVALTQALHSLLTPTAKDKAKGQDFNGRLWDALYMLSMSIKGALPSRKVNGPGPCQTSFYQLYLVVNGRRKLQELKAVCGPGDNMEPTITLMLPTED